MPKFQEAEKNSIPPFPTGLKHYESISAVYSCANANNSLFDSDITFYYKPAPIVSIKSWLNGKSPINSPPEFGSNVGVFGDKTNSSALDAECRNLLGFRYSNFEMGAGESCLGFTNSKATELKMLVLKTNELHASRYILRRPANFSTGTKNQCKHEPYIQSCLKNGGGLACYSEFQLKLCQLGRGGKACNKVRDQVACFKNGGGKSCYF